MVLRAEQIFDKVYLDKEHPSDFINYVAESIERELVNKFVDKLGDHKLYIVKLNEPEFIEDLPGSCWAPQCAYRQDLDCMKIVQCKNCRMVYPWCQRFRDELGGEGFCPYGAKIIAEADKLQDLKTKKKPFKSVWVDGNLDELEKGGENA